MTRFVVLLILAAVAAPAGVGCKKTVTSLAAPDKPAEDPDKAALQGAWAIEKVDAPADDMPGPGELDGAAFTFKDNLLTFTSRGGPTHWVYTLDSSKAPKWVDLQEADENGKVHKENLAPGSKEEPKEVEKALGIYKTEGDKLVIAFGRPGKPRPTEYKPSTRTAGGVVVFHLVRKK